MNKYIKSFHFDKDKLSDAWCKKVALQVVNHSGCKNLLAGKKVQEIEDYASGDIDMKPFIRQFKSFKRRYDTHIKNQSIEGKFEMQEIFDLFISLPLIPVKLNSAAHLIFKVPFDIQITATDSLADEKRDKDVEKLKQMQKIINIQQDIADQLSQGQVDVKGTEYSAIEFKKVPLDLDLSDPAELKIFLEIIYKLQPEAAYEVLLQLIYEMKKMSGPDLLEIYDDFKFGVRANRVAMSGITGLPEGVEYLYPGRCFAPTSMYPDYRDTSERYIQHFVTVTEFQNMVGKEMTADMLKETINGEGGYCPANNLQKITGNFDQTSIELLEIQVISADGIYYVENKAGNKRFIPSEMADKLENSKGIFGQNTYIFYWLRNTDHFFCKYKLGAAFRKQGQESITRFPSNFYKSQKISAVENCIGENKKAIVASIKLNMEILFAAPPGKFIDMKFIRRATEGLLWDGKAQAEVQKDLLDLVRERNIMIGDSEGMNGANEGQMQPVRDIAGGLGNNIAAYLQQIAASSANISRWTGINDELAGLNNNPDTLNGARKLSITYGMNAINYAYEARQNQYSNVFEMNAWFIKDAIEKGGDAKKAIEQLIGKVRTKAIDDLGSLKDHTFAIKVRLGMRQEDRDQLAQSINMMEAKNQLKRIERFVIDQTENPKEANLLLAVIEHKADKKQEEAAQRNFEQAQAMQNMKNQGMVEVQTTNAQGKKELTMVQGDVAAKLMQLGSQLRLSESQMAEIQKRALQTDRIQAGFIKDTQRIQAGKEEAMAKQIAPML